MKLNTLLFALLFLAISTTALGQSISIYDIDTTNFPTMKAKFYAFDKDGNQVRPSASELSINEDGVPRTITNVSCPQPRRIKLSVGIMVDTYKYLDLARVGTERLINFLDMPNEDELALTYMNGRASIWQDFTKNRTIAIDKAKTIPAAPGVDINTMFYSEYSGGIPLLKDRKTDKKILILVSDLHCPNLNIDVSKLIADAKAYNISIYSVLLGTTDYSGLFKRIAAGSGGTVFENVNNETDITNVFAKIAYIENNAPCEITWESGAQCLTENINIELYWKSLKSNSTYKQLIQAVTSLQVSPSFISFGKISNPEIKDTTITLTAINSDFTIFDIKLKYGSDVFSIINANFPIVIPKNSTKTLTIRCIPLDSSLNYSTFEIVSNLCSFYFTANGGFLGKKMKIQTLKLTHPNGGEIFNGGNDTLITWEGISPNDECRIEFSNDSGYTWKSLTEKAVGLKYNWKNIPLPQSFNCLIKIEQKNLKPNLDTIKNDQLLFTLKGHSSEVYDISWSPDGSRVATASEDYTGKIWDANTGQVIHSLNGHNGEVTKIQWSPDGSKVATASWDTGRMTGKIWDANTGQVIHSLNGHNKNILDIQWSPDGSKVATASWDSTGKIWDVNTGQVIHSLASHNSALWKISWSPDGSKVATASLYIGRIWDANTGQIIHSLNGHNDVVYDIVWSPDGSKVATASGYTGKIWDANTGQVIHSLNGHNGLIFDIDWSPNGRLLATSSEDKTGKIWDANTGQLINILNGHTDWLNDINWSPDGKRLSTSSRDKTAKIWNVDDNILQSDQSDAVFSIIAPEPQFQQLNIDMGQVVVGSTKDTMVTAVLCNIGQGPLHVLGVDVTNGNTNEFMVPRGAGDFFLAPSECRDMMFAFMPNQVGVRNAKITVKSTIGDYIDTINITGTGILPTVQIVNKFIDFGYIDVGMAKDTLQAITIKNISNVDIDIKNSYHSGPNDKDFFTIKGGGAFKLPAGETAKLDMRFLPTSVGRTSGTLMYEYDGIGSPAVVQLFGAGIGGVASLKLDTIVTETSKIVEYPVKLTLDSKVLKSGANAVNFDITYNNTLLYPLENYPITNKDGLATVSFKNVPFTAEPIQILETLRFKTGLGNAIETPLTISNFELIGTTEEIDVTLNDGNLKLTDVCYDGGVRLLNPNSVVSMANISPNPVNSIISIDLNLIEIGNTEVSIYNLLGEKVKTIFSKEITETGNISINSDLSDLSNGQYVVIFTTPTYLEMNNILLIK